MSMVLSPPVPWEYADKVIEPLMAGERKAVMYLTPSLTIKATRRHKPNRRERTVEILLTMGAPNFAERAFIRVAKKAGEPFPVRRVQIYPWRRSKHAS